MASHRPPLGHRQHRHPPCRGPSPVAAELGDLVLRTGRLAYNNTRWTPACADASLTRDPADLASALSDLISVMAAVHPAADAVTRIAIEDREAVYTAAAGSQLYMPTRLLPDEYDVPFPTRLPSNHGLTHSWLATTQHSRRALRHERF